MDTNTEVARPENTTPAELSRIKDALQTLSGTPFFRPFWESLPYKVRMDYNFATWKYIAKQ